ncbi:MAG: hypothetical protein FJX55_19695 [Alphaproteobacteria bacterium]|nr:hypothetical protein [Alphaproteobacteria bacterium]
MRAIRILSVAVVAAGGLSGCPVEQLGKVQLGLPAPASSPAPAPASSPQQAAVGTPAGCGGIAELLRDAAQSGNDLWARLHRACPGSGVAAYNHVVSLLDQGRGEEARRILAQSRARHPDFAPLLELDTATADPFARVAAEANRRLEAWVGRSSEIAAFSQPPPQKPDAPPLPTLVKGEFEKTDTFRARVAQAEQERAQALRRIEQDYAAAVDMFNEAVRRHNAALESEREQRRRDIPEMRRRFLDESLAAVLGAPVLADMRYDADAETFYGRLVAEHGNFARDVAVRVPLAGGQAEAFKQRLPEVAPRVRFEIRGDRMALAGVDASLGGRVYPATVAEAGATPVELRVQLAADPPSPSALPMLTPQSARTDSLLSENREHFQTALRLEDDPRLARLRQEETETIRRRQEAERQKVIEAERQRIEASIRNEQQRLRELGGPAADDLRGLQPVKAWQFRPAREPARDTLAVIIGNRNYERGISLVHYAHNDARAVRQFVVDGLRVPEENVILALDATKGRIEGLLRSTLRARVQPGRTDVLLYFSGHGMPVGDDALLLPSDALPNTAQVTGYSRDTMLAELGALGARSVTVILDACFTGTSKTGDALVAAKPLLPEPKSAQPPSNGLLVSATGGGQVAWMDDSTGHSLMTLHLLEGLAGAADANRDGSVSSEEIGRYLAEHVDRAARRRFEQPQQPQVQGARRDLVRY